MNGPRNPWRLKSTAASAPAVSSRCCCDWQRARRAALSAFRFVARRLLKWIADQALRRRRSTRQAWQNGVGKKLTHQRPLPQRSVRRTRSLNYEPRRLPCKVASDPGRLPARRSPWMALKFTFKWSRSKPAERSDGARIGPTARGASRDYQGGDRRRLKHHRGEPRAAKSSHELEIKEVAASFGITLTAEAGVILSKASAEATFEVTVTFARAVAASGSSASP